MNERLKILTESGLPFLPLDLEFPWKEMLREAENLQPLFVPHREGGELHQGWKSLCIHGLDAVSTEYHGAYGYSNARDVPYQWTHIDAPVTQEYFRSVYPASRYFRIRYMLLEPGGKIRPHRDYPQRMLGPVNFALSQPEGCQMTLDGTVVPFEPGKAILLDVSREHWVENRSEKPRIHIIVHAEHETEAWQDLLVRSYEIWTQKLLSDFK